MKKIFLITLLALTVCTVQAQLFVRDMVNPLGTAAVPILSDSVSSTGTAYLTVRGDSKYIANATIQVVVTKISGTVGGTISLQGSLDGTSFKALNTAETQTAVATVTATDASNVYHWRLTGNPFVYYRVSWTGASGQLASFTAQLLLR